MNAGGAININDGTFEVAGSGQIRSTGQAFGSGIVTTTINLNGDANTIFKHSSNQTQNLSGSVTGVGLLLSRFR